MPEKELMHDLHEKREIRKNVADRQKDIDKSKDDTKDDLEVYMAAKDMISRYRLAYRLNLVEPGQAWKIHADQILRSNVSNNLVDHRKLYRKYLRLYPEAAKRANIVLSNFDSLKKEIDNDITKLKKLIDSKRFYRVWNIWPNLDRIASRINTAEEKVRIKAEKEISQQNTSSLVEESAKEMATKQTQKWREKVAPKMYMKRDWDRFIFTKESNPVKIHEVMNVFIKNRPNDVFLLDYTGCIWNDNLKNDIKRRTGNGSLQVYIKYNPNIKTYDFYNTGWKLLEGKRPYIWEWVTMMTKDVEWIFFEQKKQAQLDAATNINYRLLSNNLGRNFPEQIATLKNIQLTRNSSLYDELLCWNYNKKNHPDLLKEFLVCTESRLDEVIKRRRANSRIDQNNPIDTWSWIFKAKFVTGSAKTEVPLFVKERDRWAASIPEYLYDYMSGRKSFLKDYLTQRLLSKWEALSHMERREQVVEFESQTTKTDEKEKKKIETQIENKKELQLYWVEKLLQIVSNLEKKDKNTPEELAEFAYHMEAIRNDILKAPKWKKISDASRQKAVKEAQRLFVEYKSNDWSRATMTDWTARKLVSDILNGASRSKIQEAASELWVNMTLSDNTSREWVVEDIINDWSEANQNYYETKRKEKFYKEIRSERWVTIDGITYKLERHPNEKKIIYTEIWADWKIIFNLGIKSTTSNLPNNKDWYLIKKRINIAESKYENKDLKDDENTPMKINNKEYDKCYQKICKLSYVNVNENWEITWPAENIKFIDDLMNCKRTISLGYDQEWLDTVLINNWMITKEMINSDFHAYSEFADKIMKTIENKRKMESEFKLTWEDMKKRYNAEIEELKRKTTLNDEEMARMAILMWLVEDDNLLNQLATEQTANGKKAIKYGWIDSLLHEHITPFLAKKGGWISGTNSEIYNDSKWLRWWWDRTDESCEKIWPVLKEIFIEVVITAVAIWLWTVTWWLWTAAVMWLRASAAGARVISIWSKVAKFTRMANLCKKLWTWARYCRRLKDTAKLKILWKLKDTKILNAYSRAGASGSRVVGGNLAKGTWRSMATFASKTEVWRSVAYAAEWTKWTSLWKKGKTLWDIVKAWNIARTEGTFWMKAVWLISEWFWFHVASTALHNAINGENILNGLNPIDNLKWYAQSVAFLWILKFLGKPINAMTSTSLEFALWERISASQFWGALKYMAWLWWEFWTLCATDQVLNVVFEWELKEMTTEDAIHSIGMILWLRLHWKIKQLKNITIKEYDKAKKQLTVDFWEWAVKINENDVYDNKGTWVSQRTWTNESLNNRVNDRVVDRATEQLHEKFDELIMSKDWITMGEGESKTTYKLEWKPNEWHNPSRKWKIIYTETGPDWKIKIKIEANSDTFVLPENSNWNNIRRRFNAAREKYVKENLNSTLELARQNLDWELSRNISTRTGELEQTKNDRETLEWKKKSLSDEINALKSRKAQLEQQLQNISKELTIQSNMVSIKDIYSIIKEGNIVSIWWKKMKFIWIKWDKIVFTEWKWKTREFSSFKELQDAKANFNFDIKNRQSERWLEQQIMFEELVWKEARTKNVNEIIREYERLQRQKIQIEQDIRDWYFRENAIKLKWKHIWIDGIEYQCTDIKTNNGRTTLDFKKTDWSDSFTISSFEQLKSRWQVNGFWDRYDVIDKETRAAWRELSRYERENHELLRGENWLFKWENKYVENKRQALQQIDQQLQNGRADYDNAKLATSTKKVLNPEYERIQKEIEWIDSQLIEKWKELTSIERDLWTSDTEIARLEQEIPNLTAERENLSRNEDEIWNRGSNWWNEWSEWNRIETYEEIKTSDDVLNKLNEIKLEPESRGFENIKLDWVTKAQFETWVFIEWVHRRFKNLSLKPNMKMSKEFLKKMRDGLVDMKNKWWEKLSEYHRKLVDKRNKFLERKLSENWDEVWIKEEEIKQLEEQEMRDNNIKDTDSPQEIADKLENSIENNADFEVGKEAFVSWKFVEWIKNWFNKIIQKPDISLPRGSIKRLKNKISEMMKKWWNKLNDGYKKLMERFDRYLNDLLKQSWEKIKIMRQERRVEKEQQRRQREEQQRIEREEQQRRERKKDQRKETEEKGVENNQLKFNDIEIFTRVDELKIDKLWSLLGRSSFDTLSKRNDVVVKIWNNKLCIKSDGNTYFIQKSSDHVGRPLNKVIIVKKDISSAACKTILEKWKIFEFYDGKIWTGGIASHINEIIVQKSSAPRTQKWKREEQEKRQWRQTEEWDDIIEAVEITGYQENIETTDWGRFTWEIKNWELYKWKFTDKNGNEWYIDKSSDYPVMRYQDKILLDRIWNKESINVGELKRTHRTNFNGLNKIIDSWIIGNNSNRWVQFWGWLWACYWEVALVMKNSVMNLPPAPANISEGHWNYDYFFSWQGARNRDWNTYQREASDFSFHRSGKGEDPNVDVPYLSIWWKNWTNWSFAHEVGIEYVEAIILPEHAKNYPWYRELVRRINEKWIKIIEAPTEENILDYAGWSVILAKDWKRWSFDKAIIEELAKRYPNIPTFEQQAITYLRETGRIKENDIRWKSFTEIREDYIKIANKNWFTRWSTRWWQYQNYSSQKNYTKEQQAYFKYIVKSRIAKEYDKYPNPKIKAIEENLDYPTWTEVYVKLEKWWETKAKVESYDTTTKEYTVRWEEWWQTLQKRVTTENLRKPWTSISILWISDPQTFINVAAELIKKWKSKTLIQDLKQELLKDSNKSELDHYKKTFLELQLRWENVDEIADYFRLRQSFNIGDFERNKEWVQKYYEEKIKPEMIETDNIKKKIMTEISSKTNWEPKDPPLKWAERASDRVIQLDYNFNSLLDVSRWTILYDNLDWVYNALNLILNHPEVKDVFLRDNFKIRSTWYRDINLAIKTRTWNCFELQLNTKKLFQAKEKWLTISKEFINSKLDKGETSNYFWIVEELYNGNKIFNETDIKIHEIINNKLKKDIPIPDINEPLTGHNLYELIRELNNISEWKAKQERELPNRLPTDSNISYQDLINYKNKITWFNNLLYDYASPT